MQKELAVLGGPPEFSEKFYVGRPNLADRSGFLALVNDMLDRRWLTNDGPLVQEFETRAAAYLGVKHCIAMCNATVALEIATRALGLTGEVIIPSFTFIATAHALQWQQITPVFADINPSTHCLDPASVEKMITPRTTGIIGVHLWGHPCAIDELTELAAARRLTLLFDAAHAFGCSYRGQMIGSFGRTEVFSFHATKFLNTLEGGAVATNDDDLAKQMRLMRNFGFGGYDKVIYIGTNGKMSEVSAAMGLTSLENVDQFVTVNRRNYRQYRETLAGLKGVRIFDYDEIQRCNFQYIVTEVDPGCPLTRDEILLVLWAENVIARRYFYPGCHRMEPYRSFYPHAGLLLPHTEGLCNRVLLLPNGTSVSADDAARIAGIIRAAVGNAAAVRRALAGKTVPT